MRWNYYKLRQLSLLQSAMDCYYKLRQLFYYKVRQGLLQIATGITKCDDYYELRQYKHSLTQMVSEPTRGENTLNSFITDSKSRTQIIPGKSDHDGVVYIEADIR